MTFRPATSADEDGWQDLLGRCASGDFLHDWAWAGVAAFDGQPQRRFVLEESGRLVALAAAQVRPIGMGRSFWYVPHGPILDYADAGADRWLAALIAGLVASAGADGGVVVRFEPRLENGDPGVGLLDAIGRRVGERLQVGQTRLVALETDEALMAGFDPNLRWKIRRGLRDGVEVSRTSDPADTAAIDRLHELVGVTQQRAGFPMPARERYRIAWRGLAAAGRGCLLEARMGSELLAAGLLAVEGAQSFYLFAGSRREPAGAPKHYAPAVLQWEMMREARERGSRTHDLWGVAPAGAGPEHPWAGVGEFKREFGGREVAWAGSWEVVVAPTVYRLRRFLGRVRRPRPAGAPG